MTTEIVTGTGGFACGAEGPLAISVWAAPPTTEHAEAAVRLLATLARTQKRVLIVAVLGPGTQHPSGAAREMLSGQLAKMGGQIAAAASVFETEGFRAATLRAVVTGILFVVRPGYPQRACANIGDAAVWLSEHAEGRMDAARIDTAIRGVRARAR